MAGGERPKPLRRVVGHGTLYAVEAVWADGPWEPTGMASFSPGAAERCVAAAPMPLRAEAWGQHELLECGHVVRTKSDHMGLTVAARRRCRHCAAGRPSAWPLAAGWGTGEPDPLAAASRQFLRELTRATDEGGPHARPDADAHLAYLLGKSGMAPVDGDGGRASLLAFLGRRYGLDDPFTLRSLLEGPWRHDGPTVALLTGFGPAHWLDTPFWAQEALLEAQEARQARRPRGTPA